MSTGAGPQGTIAHCDLFGTDQALYHDYLSGTQRGGYTLTHEWSHYFYGLLDEYQNPSAACQRDDPGAPCRDDIPVTPSVMNTQDRAALPTSEGGRYQEGAING